LVEPPGNAKKFIQEGPPDMGIGAIALDVSSSFCEAALISYCKQERETQN